MLGAAGVTVPGGDRDGGAAIATSERRNGLDHDAAGALVAVVREIAVEHRTGDAEPAVGLDSRLERDLGLDSLAVAELLVRVEQCFGVRLDEATLVAVDTPRDLLGEVVAAAARGDPTAGSPSAASGAAADAPVDGAGASTVTPAGAGTLVDVLAWHATRTPDRPHLRLLGDRGVEELTHGELYREALQVAAGLRQRGVPSGAAVALMLPTSREYFTAFLGVLLAGAVPTPIYPPGRPSGLEEHLRRHVRILDNAGAVALITVTEARRLARLVAPQIPSLEHVTTVAELRAAGGRAARTAPDRAATALLQYTSGSTGDPKGVALSHANLLANIRAMQRAGAIDVDDVFVSWLPLYHDMGLIGSWLLSLYVGIPFVALSPVAFLARPARWLRAIHEHGGTLSGGPNFGYELCLSRITDAELEGVDLSGWRIAFNGAEPVSPRTVERFAERFAPWGLRRDAITPVYGLAEGAVALTVPPPGRGPVLDRVDRAQLATAERAVPARADDRDPVQVVACGPAVPGHELRIVGPDGAPLGERRQGRIEFRGPSATRGYHRNAAASRALFDGDWLDTGDLGYLADGELHPTGRVKDLIIRAGRNLHPSDVEEPVGSLPGVRKGCVAAFAATDPRTATERLVVVAETRSATEHGRDGLRRGIIRVVSDVTGAPPDEVVLTAPGTVPKTSSGKVRRAAARERYERGKLAASRPKVWWQVARLAGTSLRSRGRRIVPAVARTVQGSYALVVLALATVVVWPLVVVLRDPARRWRVVRRVGRWFLATTGNRVVVHGSAELPVGEPYVIVANHASLLDPLVLALVVPDAPVFAAVGGLAENPFSRVFLRRLEARLIERGDRRAGLAATRELTEVARSGRPIAMFPEGRRSPAAGVEPFNLGAFQIAADAGVPVVPVGLQGTRELLPVGRRLPRRSRIEVHIARACTTPDPGWTGALALRRVARAAILEATGEPDLA